MNWVAPIKDDETLEKFKAKLREMDDKYYIMFEIGVGTGLQLQEILKFKNKDIRGKDSIEHVSARKIFAGHSRSRRSSRKLSPDTQRERIRRHILF